MAILLSIAAIVAGYGLIAMIVVTADQVLGRAILRGGPPTRQFIYLLLATGLFAAVLGGFICAWVAPGAPFVHTLILAAVVASIGAAMVTQGPQAGQPKWYPAATLVTGVLGVLAGGGLGALSLAAGVQLS